MNKRSIVEWMDLYVIEHKKGCTSKEVEKVLMAQGISEKELKETKKSIRQLGLLIDKAPKNRLENFVAKAGKIYGYLLMFSFLSSILFLALETAGLISNYRFSFSFPIFTAGLIFVKYQSQRKPYIKRKFE